MERCYKGMRTHLGQNRDVLFHIDRCAGRCALSIGMTSRVKRKAIHNLVRRCTIFCVGQGTLCSDTACGRRGRKTSRRRWTMRQARVFRRSAKSKASDPTTVRKTSVYPNTVNMLVTEERQAKLKQTLSHMGKKRLLIKFDTLHQKNLPFI